MIKEHIIFYWIRFILYIIKQFSHRKIVPHAIFVFSHPAAIELVVFNQYLGLEVCTFSCISFTVRLVGGTTPLEGRVELFTHGTWGTVCDDGWNREAANVLCRQMGYPEAIAAFDLAHFGEGTGEIVLDELDCRGTEKELSECAHIHDHNCVHSEDAGVQCANSGKIFCLFFCLFLFLFFVFVFVFFFVETFVWAQFVSGLYSLLIMSSISFCVFMLLC